MSSIDVFGSSPPRPPRQDPCIVSSSSPTLPSLDDIFNRSPKRQALRSGNNAAPIPANVRTTFTSAANLLREAPEIDIETEQVSKTPPRKSKPSKGRGRKAATPEPAVVCERESPVVIDSSPFQDKPWQKYKSKSPVSKERQPALPKGRGTKSASRKRADTAKLEMGSRHFGTKAGQEPQDESTATIGTCHDTKDTIITTSTSCHEPAVARRNDWTPPQTDKNIVLDSDSDTRELLSSLGKTSTSKEVFQTLFDDYGRKISETSVVARPNPQPEFLKKRKRLEMIATSHTDQGQHVKDDAPIEEVREQKEKDKPKAPAAKKKKKIRTITELATAPFMVPIEPDLGAAEPSANDSLLNYFDSDGAVKALVEHQTAVMSQRKGKVEVTKKPAKSKRKKKSGTVENPILLSPASALKQSSKQDFVFGTSSQLVREDSPTMLRDLQVAIQASNQVDSDPFAEPDGQGLWRAGARDEEGELMELELVKSGHDPHVETSSERTSRPYDSFVDIDDILDSPVAAAASSTLKPSVPSKPEIRSQVDHVALPPNASISNHTKKTPKETKPNYELFTDAQLARQITSFGFKSIKKRQTMIALLNQCWASKNPGASVVQSRQISTSSTTFSPPRKQPSTTSPIKPAGRPRGRPRKNIDLPTENGAQEAASTAKARGRPKKQAQSEVPVDIPSPPKTRGRPRKSETPSPTRGRERRKKSETPSPARARGRPKKSGENVVEIADSDVDDVESASAASSPNRIFSSPPPLDLSTTDEADMSLNLSPTDQQTHLFKHITKAVTSTPRSTDPLNPSWHEKMLLYDPIILEDLAAWLNSGELTRVGYDGEIAPTDVKMWCESKSVICLWRVNVRGKERKRY
ncbi:hypothetical protein F5Y15DRAFT_385044 [Xylariaceae sp. FL0016]|nr:hypothetical protein F5Y15DRAFT_385044 [Xylariaceae sp. FL0016]